MDPPAPSLFLSLPTELRCHIYDYLLADPHTVTIGAGYVTIFGHRRQDCVRKVIIPGLPRDLVPLVRSHHDPSLLSVASPPCVAMEDGWTDDVDKPSRLSMPAPLALLQTCRRINDELADYMQGRKKMATATAHQQQHKSEPATTNSKQPEDDTGLTLHVSYPYGVLVLKHLYPFLLKQARRVIISGHYSSTRNAEPPIDNADAAPSSTASASFPPRTYGRIVTRSRTHTTPSPRSTTAVTPPSPPNKTTTIFPPFALTTATHAPDALGTLIRDLFPSVPTQLARLEVRFLYPGDDSYSAVWSDDQSPVSHVLRNICGGAIDMTVKRSPLGTGMRVVARSRPEGRTVSTAWENWRGKVGCAGAGVGGNAGSVGIGEFDKFLTG